MTPDTSSRSKRIVTPEDPDLMPDGSTKPWPMRRKVAGSLLGLLFGSGRGRGKIPIDKLDRLLLVRTDRLGDAVVSTPIVALLDRLGAERGRPIRIDVLASGYNASIFEADPRIDTVYRWGGSAGQRLAILKRCRRAGYDLALQLNLSRTTNLTILTGLAAGKGRVVGRGHTYNSRLFDVVAPQSPHPHFLDQTFDVLLHAIDWKNGEVPDRPDPSIVVPESVQSETSEILQRSGLVAGGFILLNTSAGAIDRSFGIEQGVELAAGLKEIADRSGLALALSGAPEERKKTDAIAERAGRLPVVRVPSILHLAALIDAARLLVTPDTGPVHLASALSTPTVAYYAEQDKPAGWSPVTGPTLSATTDGDVTTVSIPSLLNLVTIELENPRNSPQAPTSDL